MATPLINALRVQGGTFYTFASASNDISKTFTDDDARFVFSKFVLMDLPNVETPTSNRENRIVWEGVGAKAGGAIYPNSSMPDSDINFDNNINFAQSLQNYSLNFEQLILQSSNNLAQAYDATQKYTTSERIFWKWLASINAIRFRDASASEAAVTSRYTEEDQSSVYDRVVKYIGDIDIVNNVSRDGHSYSEIYLNVPVTHGNTPLVLFKTYSDPNYSPARQWSINSEFIDGRSQSSVHPSGLSMAAYYDDDGSNSYTTNNAFGDTTNWTGYATTNASLKPVKLSNMDGVVLDTDAESYKPIVDDPAIGLISEFNATDTSSDFSFNAALVYYDIYSASNPSERGRNLYGILVLDDYSNEGSGSSFIKRYDKFKPNKVTRLNGNGYGLKLNLKFDTSADNVGVETIINDYNTFSMDLFIDASTRMQEAAEMFIDQKQEIIEVKEQINKLNQYYFSQDTIDQVVKRVSALETSLNNSQLALQSSTSLLDLINLNADNIQKILSGNLSVNLTYNTDVLKFGDGILLDRSIPNQVKVINRVQEYNNFMLCKNLDNLIDTEYVNGRDSNLTSEYSSNILTLGAFTNYFRTTNRNPDPVTGIQLFYDNVYINIDDKAYKWKKGQVLRFVFAEPIDAASYNIVFRTDSVSAFGNGAYGKIIGTVTPASLISNKPIIEIICTDENQYLFNIDITR